MNIARNGFPYGDNTNLIYKNYLHLKQTIFFTRSCKQNLDTSEIIICARLNLGRTWSIAHDENVNLNDYFGLGDGRCDTIYVIVLFIWYLRNPTRTNKTLLNLRLQRASTEIHILKNTQSRIYNKFIYKSYIYWKK